MSELKQLNNAASATSSQPHLSQKIYQQINQQYTLIEHNDLRNFAKELGLETV